MIEVTDVALRQAAGEGMDAFIGVFTGAYKKEIGGEMTAGTMSLLTGEQHSLLAYQIFRDEVMEGGFCQLIQNGYGGYIFDNPFAKVMRLWGVGDLSKLVYAAKKIYDSHRDDLERERTDEEFMAMYEQYEAFDELEDEFLEKEEEYTALVAGYVDEHLAVPGVLKEVIRGDREEGADAFIIACFGDPGLQAAREVTSIPILASRYWRDVLSES